MLENYSKYNHCLEIYIGEAFLVQYPKEIYFFIIFNPVFLNQIQQVFSFRIDERKLLKKEKFSQNFPVSCMKNSLKKY